MTDWHPMDLDALVQAWVEDPDLEGDLAHLERLAARPAVFGDVDPPLPGALVQRLAERGIDRLYRHQAQAVRLIRSGVHTVLVSGTASGKSLGYQIPMAEKILANPRTSSLLVFPTKALAQDQLRSLTGLRIPGLVAATYDGDTSPEDRLWVRRHANVILTNPDMLHFGILPNHGKWADFFLRLTYIVIDEMHVLRGIFGSHVAHVVRRLRRIAAHYGAEPTLIFASATIGNPGQLAGRLSGLKVEVLAGDDSPHGAKMIALWNPPLAEEGPRRRRSAMAEATDLFVDLVRNHQHTIVFSRSRKATELIYTWARDRLGEPLAGRIAPYRGGYLPADRRRIEAALFAGELLGVTATNALELGIDVGNLDAAIINTFPGTLASFWQQAGRAGRSQKHSLGVLVGGEDALDQYYMSHPRQLFTRPPESAVINPDNPLVVEAHTRCAAHELPLQPEDQKFLGDGMEEAANRLVQAGDLRLREGRLYWARRSRPAGSVSIRSSGGSPFSVINATAAEVLGTLEESQTFNQAHPGAVYLHQGDTFVVDRLDLATREVVVHPETVGYFTQSQEEKYLEILQTRDQRPVGRLMQSLGSVRVESHVVAFKRKKIGSGEVISFEALDLPPVEFETDAVWWTIPDDVYPSAGVNHLDIPGTLHAAEHGAIAMLPLFAICDRWDIGGLSTPFHPETGAGTIFIYEAYPGGAGISAIAFDKGADHLEATREMIDACPCDEGCPSCVQSPKCGNFNEPLSKEGAVRFLQTALGVH
ncbi:MAG: DEAD/DEAH box helicase [Acidimicrobiia bacterium]